MYLRHGRWTEVSWEAAVRRCTELLAPVIAEYGIGGRHRVHRQPARAFILAGPLYRGAARHVRHAGHLLARLMHPDDARPRGVAHGDVVVVRSEAGEIEVQVEVTDAIKRGVVSLPHGWGHGKPGTRLSVANGSPGVNTNVLPPPTFLDEPSGNGALNGIPVTVSAL